MSLQNNNTNQNGKGGSGKIYPIATNDLPSIQKNVKSSERMSLDSAHTAGGEDAGGSSSNRHLLGENYQPSNQPLAQIQQPFHETRSAEMRSSFESSHNEIQQQRFTENESAQNPQKNVASSMKARQNNNGVNNRTETISIMDHLETEQQMLTTRDADKLLATSDDMPLSLRENTGKRTHKVEFNFDTGSQDGQGSLGAGITHSELPTQPGDDGANQQMKSRLQRKQTGKQIKRDKLSNFPKRESTKIMTSYITTVTANSQLKNGLSMKGKGGRRTSVIGSLGTLGYTIQLADGQNSQDNNSSDSDLEHMSQWRKILHVITNSLSLTSVIPFNSKFRMYWDFIVIALGLWVCFTTPLDVAFEPQSFKLRNVVAFNEFIDVLFILDIVFNFRTSIADFITGDEISDSKTIAIQYLKGQFFIDLIAAIPMDLILGVNQNMEATVQDSSHHRILYGSAAAASAQIPFNATSSPTNGISNPSSASAVSVEILNILSILKIMRVLRFTKIITFLNTSENVKLSLRLFKLIFYLMIYIHWQACAWFYYTKWDRMWLPLPDIIRQDYHFYDHGVAFTYCFSIWHSVSILDGDDMVPANPHQAIVVSVLVIISEFIHAHIIGTMDVVLHSLSSKSVHFQEKIEFVTTTMKSIRLDHDVQQKVLKYVSKVHSQMDQRKHLNKLMESLSPSLQHLITRHMFMNIISDHPAFKSLPELFEFLVESIEAIQYMPEQFIFKEGSKATHLYILEDGSCEVLVKGSVLRKEIFVREIEAGNIFGEVALINGLRRTASVRSKVHCTVGAITEENFGELIRYFPEVKNRMKEQCRKYNDHWKDYQINVLANIHYLRNVPYNVREDLHYKLTIENFEAGAKLFNRGQECDCIMIVVNGQVELFVEQREQEYILDTIGIGSTIGAYSVLNNCHYEYTGRAKNKVSCLILQRQDLLDAAQEDPVMTEALDSATQYIVHNEVPLCDYSTLNNKDPIETHVYVDQIDDAVTPIERFRRAIEKVMVLNRRNEVKLSKLFATIRRLKEERDQKANILGQVSSGIVNPENETLGQKLRRGIQNALQNLQKGETKAESETLMTSLKAQFQEKENANGGNIKGGVGVPLKEFTRLMNMMENLQQDMKQVKQALNIPEPSHRYASQRKESIDQTSPHQGPNYMRDNSLLPPSSSRKNQGGFSPTQDQMPTFQEKMDILNREQAALPIKKNIIALLVNAKIELQKEAILKQKREEELAALAKDEALKIQNKAPPMMKQKSEQSLMKGSFKNQDINRVQSLQSPNFKNENQQSPQSLNTRQISGEQNQHSQKIQSFAHNSKVGSGSSHLGKQSDKGGGGGPLEELSVNESVGHHGLAHDNNSPITRASSVLRRRDPFNNQKHNLNGNNNQLEIDEKKQRNFIASEAYSNNFDVPHIAKDGSPAIHRHFTMADENFQDVMTVPVPISNVDRSQTRNSKEDNIQQQITEIVENLEASKEKQLPPELQTQPLDVKQVNNSGEEVPNKASLINEKLVFTDNNIGRQSLDHVESIQDLQEDGVPKGEESGAHTMKAAALKASQGASRNTFLNQPSGSDQLFKPTSISLSSIELMNKSNTANGDATQTTKLMMTENAKHYQSSLHQQRSNFAFGPGSGATTITPPNISNNQFILEQAGSLVELIAQNKNSNKAKKGGEGTIKSRNSSDVSQFVSHSVGGVGKNSKNHQKWKKGQKSNPSLLINSELSSDNTPMNQINSEGHESGLNPQIAIAIGYHKANQVKKPAEINVNNTEGSLQYIQKMSRSPSPPTIPMIIESKVQLNSNQLLHPKSRAEAGRENPYLGSLPVPKPYTGSISPNERSNRSLGPSTFKQKKQESNRRRRDISATRDQEMNPQTNNAQEEPEGGIDDMIEQEIARIHGLNSATSIIVGRTEETAMGAISSNTNQNKNYKKTGAGITANNSTNQQNKQNNR